MLDAASTLTETGFKVAMFSAGCTELVRAAGKGLREGQLMVESSKSKGEASELNAETLSGRMKEKQGEKETVCLNCNENM
jgi:hypothetical protein